MKRKIISLSIILFGAIGCPAYATKTAGSMDLSLLAEKLGVEKRLPLSDITSVKEENKGYAINLNDALRGGIAHSYEVEASVYHQESFNQNMRAAMGALLMKLDFRISGGVGASETQAQALAKTYRREEALTMTQPLIDYAAYQEYQRQSMLSNSADVELMDTKAKNMLEVANAFLATLQSKLVVTMGEEYELLLKELEDYMKARAAGGGASQADFNRVKSRVSNLRSALTDARASAKVNARNLERLIGDLPAWLDMSGSAAISMPESMQDARSAAMSQNMEIVKARKDAEAVQREIETSRARFFPKLTVEVSATRTLNSGGTPGFMNDNKVMLVLTQPLFAAGSDLAQLRAVVARLNESQAKIKLAESKLGQEIEASFDNMSSASERYDSVLDELESNKKVVTAFKEQLTSSNRSLLDVLDAYQRLHQSRLDLVQLFVVNMQTRFRIAYLTGQLSDEEFTKEK